MVQVTKMTPAPGVLIVAALSLAYLCSSDIFALINYVGFATWVPSNYPQSYILAKKRGSICADLCGRMNIYLTLYYDSDPSTLFGLVWHATRRKI